MVFRALTLKFPVQTSLSVAPKLPVSLSLHEKCPNFNKRPICGEIYTFHFPLNFVSRNVTFLQECCK